MKTIITRNIADPTTKYPFPAGGLDHLQQASRESLDAGLKRICGNNFILWGCINSTPGGSTYTISAGAIYATLNFPAWSAGAYTVGAYVTRSGVCYMCLNNTSTDPAADTLNWIFIGLNGDGQVFSVDAQTLAGVAGAAVCIPVLTFAAIDPITFIDGSGPYNVHSIVKIKLADQASGSGISQTSATDYLNLANAWINIGATGAPAFQNSFANVAEVCRFKKTIDNRLLIGGYITNSGGLFTSEKIIFTLPAAFRATNLNIATANCTDDAGNRFACFVRFATNGDVSVQPFGNAKSFFLDGVSIPMD